MPLPAPRSGKNPESKKEFISRCAGDKNMNEEFSDNAQRLAICYQRWETIKKKAKAIVGSGDNERLFEA